jgi:hypothetical protein
MFIARGRMLGRDPSGMRSMLAWAVCRAWSAQCSACCALYVEASSESSDIVASSGTMLAPALSTDGEQEQQHILTPASAKTAPAQRHAHHCSICGAVRHTHIQTQTRARIHTGAHTHIHMYTHKHTDTRARTHTHTQTHRHTCAHTHTRARKHARTHTHTHMHMHAHIVRVMGFANFSTLLATLPHLSLSQPTCYCAELVWLKIKVCSSSSLPCVCHNKETKSTRIHTQLNKVKYLIIIKLTPTLTSNPSSK